MGIALSDRVERRSSPRHPHGHHGIVIARVRPGYDVSVLDVSSGGALVEGRCRLLPGSRVELQLQSAHRRVAVRGVVLRCAVSRLRPASVSYRGAIGFDRLLPWLLEGDPAGYPVLGAETRPPHPNRADATPSIV